MIATLRSVEARCAALGLLVALFVFAVLPGVPALSVAAGSVSIVAVLLVTRDGRKRYAVAGTLYLLSLGFVFAAVRSLFGPVSAVDTAVPAAVLFGLVSLLFLSIKAAGRAIARETLGLLFGEETTTKLYDAVMTALATLGFLLTLIRLSKKVTVHGGSGIGGALTFGLSLLGVEQIVGVPLLDIRVDLVLFLFIGFVLAGFYTFESLNTAWVGAKAAARAGGDAGKRAGSKTRGLLGDWRSGGTDDAED